eukprot:9244966-Pyramimonas_sp.AAC.1
MEDTLHPLRSHEWDSLRPGGGPPPGPLMEPARSPAAPRSGDIVDVSPNTASYGDSNNRPSALPLRGAVTPAHQPGGSGRGIARSRR